MGVYVKYPDGSMHWDESKADPNPNGGSVIDASSGRSIPGANRQSGPTGPGGNGPSGSQANPYGNYHGNVSTTPGQPYGSGGFISQQSGKAPTPFADYVKSQGFAPLPNIPGWGTSSFTQTPGDQGYSGLMAPYGSVSPFVNPAAVATGTQAAGGRDNGPNGTPYSPYNPAFAFGLNY